MVSDINLYFLLGFLGVVYRNIQERFINMENMFTLMEEDVEVTDHPDATRKSLFLTA